MAQQQPQGVLQRLKAFVLGSSGKLDKQRLAELGLGAFAAYGTISNVNAGVLITIAWLTIVKTQGCTPLAAGMWCVMAGPRGHVRPADATGG